MRKGRILTTLLASCLFVSSLMAADNRKTTKTVAPPYPPLAQKMRVEGSVKLEVAVDADGRVGDVRVVSGHPLLKTAAQDCVKQWAYESGSKTVESVVLVFKLTN